MFGTLLVVLAKTKRCCRAGRISWKDMAVSSKFPVVCVRMLDVPMLTCAPFRNVYSCTHRITKAQCVADYQKQPSYWECGICVCRAAQFICQGEAGQLTVDISRAQMVHELANYREWMLKTLNQVFGISSSNDWGASLTSLEVRLIHIHIHTKTYTYMYTHTHTHRKGRM